MSRKTSMMHNMYHLGYCMASSVKRPVVARRSVTMSRTAPRVLVWSSILRHALHTRRVACMFKH